MDWKLGWDSGALDEICLVYEKAEAVEGIADQLRQLEDLALSEARNYCRVSHEKGAAISAEQFDGLGVNDKERLIGLVGGLGLSGLSADTKDATIRIKLSPVIQDVMGCTILNILNRLEKLDGAFDVLVGGKAKLELQEPLGGRKGIFQWVMLIMRLYPWLSVKEVSTNEVACELGQLLRVPAHDAIPANAGETTQCAAPAQPVDASRAKPAQTPAKSEQTPKKSLFARLFGRKDS